MLLGPLTGLPAQQMHSSDPARGTADKDKSVFSGWAVKAFKDETLTCLLYALFTMSPRGLS